MRKIAAFVLTLSVVGAPLTHVNASPLPSASPDLTRVYPGESYAQWRRYPPPRYYGQRYYGPRYYYRRDNGAAVAAGVAGLAAGALIGGAIANSQAQAAVPPPPATVDPQLAAYCARRYRSFDPVTGTYLAVTGERIVCTY
jgi:BA14K-like protein